MIKINPSQLGSYLDEAAWESLAKKLRLSAREAQIVRGIFRDLKEATIADELQISHHTVHSHLHRLYAKLNVGSREQLIVVVLVTYLSMNAEPNGSPLHGPALSPAQLTPQ
jgi:ATP/maltotriose-dependent transcriptional regulator MalT